jgi:ABC-type transport system involved in multi-copper enzyme maturation permease subunit
MLRSAHLKLIAGHSVRHGIRGGAGLVSLALTLLIGLVLAYIVVAPLESIDQRIEQTDRQLSAMGGKALTDAQKAEAHAQINEEVKKIAGKAIDFVVDPDEAQSDFLTQQKPAIISAILVLLCLVTPLFSCLAGFNQTAGDIATKGLRFLLIRTERPNIFLGRFIGTYLFTCAVNLALMLILSIYLAASVKVHAPGEMVLWMLGGYVRIQLLVLPYIAICALVSAAIDSGFASLVVALMLSYLFPLLVLLGSRMGSPKIAYGQYLTPWGYKYWLLQPVTSIEFWGGALVMCAFTAGVLWLGLSSFKKRDL